MGSKFREQVSGAHIDKGCNDILLKLLTRLKEKGYGSYASRHEILGIIEEEMLELKEAVRINTPRGYIRYKEELMDVAVAALFGYISMDGGYIKPPKKR